jgi:hypothetical protein
MGCAGAGREGGRKGGTCAWGKQRTDRQPFACGFGRFLLSIVYVDAVQWHWYRTSQVDFLQVFGPGLPIALVLSRLRMVISLRVQFVLVHVDSGMHVQLTYVAELIDCHWGFCACHICTSTVMYGVCWLGGWRCVPREDSQMFVHPSSLQLVRHLLCLG